MAELTVPSLDFSSLGQLPQLYKQGQADALRQQTLSSLGQGGTADASALLRSGDLSLAQLGIAMQNREADRGRQAAQDTESARRWGEEMKLRRAQFAENQDYSPEELDARRVSTLRANGVDLNSPEARNYRISGEWSGGGNGKNGLQPIYGARGDQPVVMQMNPSGVATETKLPDGVTVSKEPIKIDNGTHWTLLDPITRQVIGQQPKNVAAVEAESKAGEAQGKARAALANGAEADADRTIKLIDQFSQHKGFNEVFGQIDQFRPSWTHSNAGADALARYKQLKGTAFLSAYAMLKGGGAITDIEGQKAGDAMARLDRAQSEDEAKEALKDFKEAVTLGVQKLRRAASGGSATAAPTNGVVDYRTYFGGQ